MVNVIPVLGWLISFGANVSMAIPFWLVWTQCGIGEEFFFFLPQAHRAPGFWACVGIFIVVSILKAVLLPRQHVSIENKINNKSGGY